MSVHVLKTWPEYFEAVADGRKTFEIRKDDRGFQVGDTLLLQEYVPNPEHYTGRNITSGITYITSFGQLPGWVVMSIMIMRGVK